MIRGILRVERNRDRLRLELEKWAAEENLSQIVYLNIINPADRNQPAHGYFTHYNIMNNKKAAKVFDRRFFAGLRLEVLETRPHVCRIRPEDVQYSVELVQTSQATGNVISKNQIKKFDLFDYFSNFFQKIK